MGDGDLEELLRLLGSTRRGERLRAMNMISAKTGGAIIRKVDDPRVIPLLLAALRDPDRRVRRAAARGLRPCIADDPAILDVALPAYAAHDFDGTFSHAGLYDTLTGEVWIPRFAAVKGHAALLRDGNTDRYFRFELFVPGQAPQWTAGGAEEGHLVLYFVPEWSYSRQALIPEYDERLATASLREQERLPLTSSSSTAARRSRTPPAFITSKAAADITAAGPSTSRRSPPLRIDDRPAIAVKRVDARVELVGQDLL